MLGRYAQDICESTSDIIGYDVLITNKSGIIIGSSMTGRIGTMLHEAPSVIESRKSYIMTEEEAQEIKGSRGGVTYPIEDTEGDIIGTIAITGDPDKVLSFALIVKKQAEMILREKAFLEAELYHERILRNFIKDVIALDPMMDDYDEVLLKGKGLGYIETFPYVVLNISFGFFDFVDGQEESLLQSKSLSLIKGAFGRKGDMAVSLEEGQAIVFHPVAEIGNSERDYLDNVKKRCQALCDVMAQKKIRAFVGVGGMSHRIATLGKSYSEAVEVLKKGRKIRPDRRVFVIEAFRLEELVDHSRKDIKAYFVEKKLKPLSELKNRDDFEETILEWCNCNFSVKETSSVLHLHRNTLRYRLERLEDLFGYSFRDFSRMIELYLAIKLRKLEKE